MKPAHALVAKQKVKWEEGEEVAAGVAQGASKRSGEVNGCRNGPAVRGVCQNRFVSRAPNRRDLRKEAVRVLQCAREAEVQAQAHSASHAEIL